MLARRSRASWHGYSVALTGARLHLRHRPDLLGLVNFFYVAQMFSWGSGEFGRLGYQTPTKYQKIPKQVLAGLGNHHICKVSCGVYHSAVLTTEGVLFTWGRGLNGQLGLGSFQNQVMAPPLRACPPAAR